MRYIILFLLFMPVSAISQIVPPGLGNTRVAGWAAIGMQQKLGTSESHWLSESYVGAGSMSDPEGRNPFDKSAILIINQEFKNRFHEQWEYSLALSYRRQHEYANTSPYQSQGLKQEFRFYGRFSYIFKTGFAEITPTFRQEFQKYFTSGFGPYPESYKLRSRFRLKFRFPVSENKRHHILFYSEQLFSVSRMNTPAKWTDFAYRDSRFSLYYSFSPQNSPLTFDLGYMNNVMGTKQVQSASYFAIDVIWKGPFGRQRNDR